MAGELCLLVEKMQRLQATMEEQGARVPDRAPQPRMQGGEARAIVPMEEDWPALFGSAPAELGNPHLPELL